jgi:CheY-like chemotaxis protein
MAFTGSIKGWSVTEMIQLVRSSRKTGAMLVSLQTELGEEVKSIFFRNGMVNAVDAGADALSSVMLDEGFITKADFDQAIQLGKEQYKGKRTEQILMAMGKVDNQKLVRAIRIQIEKTITELIQQKKGVVSFDPDALPKYNALANGVEIQGIMLSAAVRVDEMSIIKDKVPSNAVVPKRTKRGEEQLKEIALKLDEWKIFLAIDGKADVKTIAIKTKFEEFAVMKAIAFFIEEKWMELDLSQVVAKKKVLVVDDSSVIRKMVEMALADAGYNLINAATGEAGFKLATEETPDLILLDVMLPDTTGLKVCKSIRQTESEALKKVPIIMLSAKDAEIDKNLGIYAGANDYITKPFESQVLLAKVKQYLSHN